MRKNYDQKTLHYTAEGRHFEFWCFTDDLRDGYIERAAMLDSFTLDVYEGSCRVYNRPWQSFNYQTAALGAIARAQEEEARLLREEWKEARGYVRMTAGRLEEYLASEACTSERLRALRTLRWIVSDRIPTFGPVLGNQERSILENLDNVELQEDTSSHLVYRLTDSKGHSFEWDDLTRSVVG